MKDIIQKSSTLREATAQAIVRVSKQETITAIEENTVPKGNVFEMSRAAGLLGVKKTPDLLPDCHPLPIEATSISYQITGLEIYITIEVKTIYKTGVEVEAMHGASVVALNMYDMLKPIDKGIEISTIKLLNKKGGKSDYQSVPDASINTAVIVTMDEVVNGKKDDRAGKSVLESLDKVDYLEPSDYRVTSNHLTDVKGAIEAAIEKDVRLILTVGGTGLSSWDQTPEIVKTMLDKEVPGIMEAARNYGMDRTPYAMISRGVAGLKGDILIITLPGSSRGAVETLEAILPAVSQIFRGKDFERKAQDK
jgi:cyclic pyranopterin phosphate synthase